MKTFVTVYLKNHDVNHANMIIDFFKDVVGHHLLAVTKKNLSLIFDDVKDVSFEEIINTINYEFLINAKLFKGPDFDNEELLNNYLDMVDELDFSNNSKLYLNEAVLIINNLGNKEIIKKNIFKDNLRLEEEIKTFLDQNMNISKAADLLFLHRNTMMNKIDKFIETSGYDIKKFKDAFIIYHLL